MNKICKILNCDYNCCVYISYHLVMSNINEPEIYPELINIKNISPNLASDDFLKLMQLDFPDFEWKKVASIWWFGILEMDLAKQWVEVEMIDPIYSSNELQEKKWQETYDWLVKISSRKDERSEALDKMITKLRTQINDINQEIAILFDNETSNLQEYYDKYDQLQHLLEDLKQKEFLQERRDVLYKNKSILKDNLLERKKDLPENLILNPSRWDDIHNISEWSKDYIFINHVLNYFPDEINIFLEQADKILKDWWTIYIVDYVDKLSELQDFFRKNWTYNILWWTFCGSLKKWEFKNFWK